MHSLETDYIVVGSGLSGAVLARELHDHGCRVAIIERRPYVGGNVHDHVHPSGIRIHTYGPHFFRTNSDYIWNYVNRFAEFYTHSWCVQSTVNGSHQQWPVTSLYVKQLCGNDWAPDFTGTPSNFEEACLSMMPAKIYDLFVRGYTEKQWGVPATSLAPELAGRFELRDNNDPRLKLHTHQGLPLHGYTSFMEELLRGTPVILNTDYLSNRSQFHAKKLLIYTGPIDEFFECSLGRLSYRAQQREHTFYPDAAFLQPVEAVNHPSSDDGAKIRSLEWKRMLPSIYAESIKGTVITTETPYTPADSDAFEYPFPDAANRKLAEEYKALAKTRPDVLFCGRLGEYKYFDMDQAVHRALMLSRCILCNIENVSLQDEIYKETRIIELEAEFPAFASTKLTIVASKPEIKSEEQREELIEKQENSATPK